MIRTLNLNRQATAILENAYAISYEKQERKKEAEDLLRKIKF